MVQRAGRAQHRGLRDAAGECGVGAPLRWDERRAALQTEPLDEGRDDPRRMKWLVAKMSPSSVAARGADALRSASAKMSLGWRPLLGLWLGIVCLAGILQWLGPPADRPSHEDVRRSAAQPARSVEAKPVAGTAAPAPQAAPGKDEQVAPPSESRSADPVPPEKVAAAPASSAEAHPAPPSLHAQSPAPAGDPPAAPAPRTSDREDAPARKALLVLHASRSQVAEAAAEQLAPRVGLSPGQIEARAAADPPPRAVIRFYAAADHALARRIGQELSRMGYSWRIENLSDRPPLGYQVPEVWLSDR